MRGLRSLIVLLVIALPLGWYAYRDSTKPADSGEPKAHHCNRPTGQPREMRRENQARDDDTGKRRGACRAGLAACSRASPRR